MKRVRVRAPGRVNLLGEHTDYAGGLCLPLAINRYVEVTVEKRDHGVRIETSLGVHEATCVEPCQARWAAYVMACCEMLGIEGGFALRAAGDLPMGKGLGSSGAYTVAITSALAELFELEVDRVRIAWQAERRTGVDCGILDQSASALARAGHALLLDVARGTHEHVPFAGRIAVLATPSSRELVSSGYNQRVREWREAERRQREGIELGETLRRRVEHIERENQRVREGVQCLRNGDLAGIGQLMYASQRSLRELYEVSTPELDTLVERARGAGALGAKLTGAGFGGAVVCLLAPQASLALEGALILESAGGVNCS